MNLNNEQTLISGFSGKGDAPAVSCLQETISYAELDQRSQQLAQVLRARGVSRDVPVAICLERSIHRDKCNRGRR